MVPGQLINITSIETTVQPSLTYQLDLEKKRITNKIDNQEAIQQAVMKILNTERYSSVIYSSQYGVELERLVGRDYEFIYADIERTITEALLADDRILNVTDFQIEKTSLNALQLNFIVNTILGSASINYEVQIL